MKLVRVTADSNQILGIMLFGVSSFSMSECRTGDNRPDPMARYGDGVIASFSDGTIQSSVASLNGRAGFSVVENSLVALADCFLANPINLIIESGASLMDDGGNCCDTFTPCGVCVAQSPGALQPSLPPP